MPAAGEEAADYGDVVLPADCLSIQEIGAAAGAFMVFTWLILLVTALFMLFKAVQSQTEASRQMFCYINAFICAVTTSTFADSYFAMFSGMGWETIEGCRQFFYIRLVEFAVTGALMILGLGLLAEQDYPTIWATMGCNVGMCFATYIASTATVPVVKWLWFLLSLVLFVPIVYVLLREFRQTVIDRNDPDRIELYGRASLLLIIVWAIYPFVWLLSVGMHALGVSLEVICYCVLDILAKVFYAFMMVNLGLYSSVAPQSQTQKEYV